MLLRRTDLVLMFLLDQGGLPCVLLKQHLGPAKTGDLRKLEIVDVNKSVPVDANNDGITDQIGGVDVYETIKNKQVTIIIKQGSIEEKFRRLFLAGV